jgi:DNA-binding LacI/PurR family transcriptional regulator
MPPTSPSSPLNSRKRVRMRDVANRCGVSISTVSLVLSGDARIPEDTARKVLQAVKAMEYRPSVLARSLARRISRTIGVILPEFGFVRNKPFYYQALQGIHSQTQPAGYKMVVEAANRVFLARRYYLRLLKEQSADAMIYLAASISDEFLREMEKEPYPFILVGSYVDGADLTCIKSDDVAGAKMAVQHLISLGHKAIAHVAGSPEMSHGRDRELGYREAMKEAGLEVQASWVVPGNFELEQAEQAAQSLAGSGVTAIFAGSDVMAYGVMRGLKAQNRRIPDDIAVVGMDDLEMSAWINPSLTTVRYDIRLMAELATKFAIRRVQTPITQKSLLSEIPAPELIIRSSCGAKK